jgi:AraC family transcriptional regulator
MTGSATWAQYEKRLRRVSEYIYQNLDSPLDFDHLAQIACLSPWHWHRVYRAVHGETITATVKRLRLQRAAAELAHTALPVSHIAKRAGYPDLSSFSRTFKSAYGQAPATYRKQGSHTGFQRALISGETHMYDVQIRNTPGMTLAGIPHTGSYMEIGKAFELLFGTVFARNLFNPACGMIGVYYDDPDVVPVESLKSHACITVDDAFPMDAPFEKVILPAGPCAVLTHKGPYADMPKAYQWLFAGWLPQSGHTIRDIPMFEVYLNNPRDTPPKDLLTEIWMPLQA